MPSGDSGGSSTAGGSIMRSAVISAAAVLTGCSRAETERTAPPPTAAAAAAARRLSPPTALPRPGRREERARAGDDDAGRVLQGGAGPLELAHHRADAHHLRFLPALHQAAGGPTREGDGAQGAPVRQPQRHRAKGTAPSAPRSRGWSARSRPPSIPRSSTSMRDKPDQSFPVKLGAKTFERHAQGHRLRRDQRRLPASEHHDGQADGRRQRAPRAGVLLGGRRLHRVERVHASQEEPAEVSVQRR